jgi:hypothetical protein
MMLIFYVNFTYRSLANRKAEKNRLVRCGVAFGAAHLTTWPNVLAGTKIEKDLVETFSLNYILISKIKFSIRNG